MGFQHRGRKTAKRLNGREVIHQQTLKSPISCTGVTLHSGSKVSMTLRPADVDTGIIFKRIDIGGAGALIPAKWDRVVATNMCTTLGNDDGVIIGTVEHLMAALSGCGIDNAVVEVSGPEVPAMDGSAAPFVFLVECAGVIEQTAPRRAIRVLKPVSVGNGDGTCSLNPVSGDGFTLGFEIEFDSPAVARQVFSIGLYNGTFKKELARARTFGFLHEVEELRASGLAQGGSLDNAVVVSGEKVLNEDGLRYEDEFVRHKALDAMGDLYLAGAPIIGSFHGICSGHAANNRLLKALFDDPAAWTYDVLRPAALDESEPANPVPAVDEIPVSAALA